MRKAPLIAGILNVTPDSFSDGGRYYSREAAVDRAAVLVEDGADIIDIGGESTRPGAEPIGSPEELNRVLPVVEAIRHRFAVRISIDTTKLEVAREAAELGATVLNDVSGGRDIRMAELVRDYKMDIILMHMQGTPQTMQDNPSYPGGVIREVRDFLYHRVRAFEEVGVPNEKIWVDPGIGFGKTLEDNFTLLHNLDKFCRISGRLAIGVSRKSLLAKVLDDPEMPFEKREAGTIASNLWAYHKGASVFRVHDVGRMKRALLTWEAIQNAGQ